MNPEQQAAYVNAQAACALAELMAMTLENDIAVETGVERPHKPQAFRNLPLAYCIGRNDVIGMFVGR
jgi:hypothetical protein